jgi:GT2 family glycosyltransferase
MTDIIPGLVSTIIPVFNRPEMLQRAVDSVLAQTWRPIEIIISDDGSTDGTPALGRQLAADHPGVIHYLWNPNRGAGAARETGRLHARGEFIQYLDSDDTLWPRKFEVQVAALRAQPHCGAAYGWIRFCAEGQPPREQPHKWSARGYTALFPALLVDRWWNTDAPLWRRAVCDAIGPWSDLRYSQDWEYDARAGGLGISLAYCPEFVTDQHHHATLRQTGHGKWLAPPDRLRFLTQLYRQAHRAGVQPRSPEMQHFLRFLFLNARQCAAMGEGRVAAQLLQLADEAEGRRDRQRLVYRILSQLFGWQRVARGSEALRHRLGKRNRPDSQRLSWMEPV